MLAYWRAGEARMARAAAAQLGLLEDASPESAVVRLLLAQSDSWTFGSVVAQDAAAEALKAARVAACSGRCPVMRGGLPHAPPAGQPGAALAGNGARADGHREDVAGPPCHDERGGLQRGGSPHAPPTGPLDAAPAGGGACTRAPPAGRDSQGHPAVTSEDGRSFAAALQRLQWARKPLQGAATGLCITSSVAECFCSWPVTCRRKAQLGCQRAGRAQCAAFSAHPTETWSAGTMTECLLLLTIWGLGAQCPFTRLTSWA